MTAVETAIILVKLRMKPRKNNIKTKTNGIIHSTNGIFHHIIRHLQTF